MSTGWCCVHPKPHAILINDLMHNLTVKYGTISYFKERVATVPHYWIGSCHEQGRELVIELKYGLICGGKKQHCPTVERNVIAYVMLVVRYCVFIFPNTSIFTSLLLMYSERTDTACNVMHRCCSLAAPFNRRKTFWWKNVLVLCCERFLRLYSQVHL